jgi:hypothetical protein
MDRFMDRQNVELYRRLRQTPDVDERLRILKLLADRKLEFKLEFHRRLRSGPVRRRSSFTLQGKSPITVGVSGNITHLPPP